MQKPGLLLVVLALLLTGCVQPPDSPAFKPSGHTPGYTQESFDRYVDETKDWLKENRAFITDDPMREVEANAPFELLPEKTSKKSKGVLLVHGLGDSPYSFTDIAPLLAEQGFRVRVMLLPGHGSKPADLMNVEVSDWIKAVEHQTQLLKSEVDEVWLGGFSTGGNLVTSYALEDESIQGLLLFSPAFQPDSRLVALAPIVSKFFDWADIDPVDNFVRYDSLTFNAAGEYYRTSQQVRDQLEKKEFNRPVLIVMSEDDSVLNSQGILQLFEERFTNPDSRFIWYGDQPASKDPRVHSLRSKLPEQNVSNFSHMAALFAPENPYYGKNGSYRMCNNGQEESEATCQKENEVWYSAHGYTEEGKIHARLTWNPYFENLAREIRQTLK